MNERGTKAVVWTSVGTLVVIGLAALFVWLLLWKPAYGSQLTAQSAVSLGTSPTGQKTATVHLNIVQQVGVGQHADWLGYQTPTNPLHPGTVFNLPAHALVTVIVHNFDSRTALRNTFFTLVQGTVGNVEYVNGKKMPLMSPDLTSHTFTIPDLGVSVPMEGIPNNAAPNAFETIKFTFKTVGPGRYRWQCIVPCGSGLYGNGGPMSEIGYM